MTIMFDPDKIPDFNHRPTDQAFEWLRRKAWHNKSKNSDHALLLCAELVRLKEFEEYIKQTTGVITNSDVVSNESNPESDEPPATTPQQELWIRH